MLSEATLSGWGRWPQARCRVGHLDPLAETTPAGPAIARGLGRGYGDCALSPEATLLSARCDRFLDFDPQTGALAVEVGVTAQRILATFTPRGWFLPVVPGTRHVTVGGMIAADVHGKNHHGAGSFGHHVDWIDILCADGRMRRSTRADNDGLFHMTLGGMGLTGHILRAGFRLAPIGSEWMRTCTIVAPDLDAAMAAFEENLDARYSVAWIDCLARGRARGRSLVYLGDHLAREEAAALGRAGPPPARRGLRAPFDAPSCALNRLTVGLFNRLFYRAGVRGPGQGVASWETFFFPLDAIGDWNRIYGRRGFAQHQCVLPLDAARPGLDALLAAISQAGLGSFLAVLKRFDPGDPRRPLSFPIEGYTLALDFPMSGAALRLMERLDATVRDHGGRLYLAKDSRMSRSMLEAGYGPAVERFRRWRVESGAAGVFESLLSRRLGL